MQQLSLKLKTTLMLLVTLVGFNALAGDDLIFKNSFEPPEFFELIFITPNENQVVDQDTVLVKVRASLGNNSENTLQSVYINTIETTGNRQGGQQTRGCAAELGRSFKWVRIPSRQGWSASE